VNSHRHIGVVAAAAAAAAAAREYARFDASSFYYASNLE
jgi:hypothetical protein